MSMVCKEKSYKFSKILKKYLVNISKMRIFTS